MAALAEVRDKALATLAADPWQDPGMAVRFAERMEWLLGEPDPEDPLDLYPAEAALLVLIPFLYRANWQRTTARCARVDPTRLESARGADADRRSFEAFAASHERLLKRATLRPEAAPAIGWWLFHRWMLSEGGHADPDSVRELLVLIGEPARALGEILHPSRVVNLLHAVRRGPDVTNAEFLDRLPAEDRVRAPGHQFVRDRRLALLAALAYGTCAEITTLPDIVVEHLGIPHPVDLGQLRDTVQQATWGGKAALPTLRAECHHEAVVEGLRQYTARADEILHQVHRAAQERITHPMPVLPTRLSADDVSPAEGAFDGWAGFRLDERRIREILMGVQLYKDRDLAVRELYQNALDACRYRRARTQYLDQTSKTGASYTYDGLITFTQGTDADGRAYLECRDNGIGMSDAELRGVFSQAGARFAEQADFKLEHATWSELSPPVRFYANSRFGIGVLSYFMLADELTVTTCRMGLDGTPGQVLSASIHGPGHLFRIVTVADRGERPGTCVRLYLHDDADRSCVDVLERVLGVAEFTTTAMDDTRCSEWPAGQLRTRKQPAGERFGFEAHGARAAWAAAPEGVQVTWTQYGGALLVDGLVVQPAHRTGILSTADSGLTGVVVNLIGPYAPAQLSTDRAEVLDNVAPALHDLLTRAADALVASEHQTLPEYSWICRIAHRSAPLADALTQAAMRAGRRVRYGEGATLDIGRAGILPSDADMLLGQRSKERKAATPWEFSGNPPDHIYLWRLLAHDRTDDLRELAEFCPELMQPRPLLAALPSDQLLLCYKSNDDAYWSWNRREFRQREAVEQIGVSADAAARRAALLRDHDLWPEGLQPGAANSSENLALLADGLGGSLRRDASPTVTRLVYACAKTGQAPQEIATVWRDHGLVVPDSVVTLAIAGMDDDLLMQDSREGTFKWFGPDEAVPPGRLAQASIELGLDVPEICERYHAYGLRTDHAGLPDRPVSQTVTLLREFCDDERGGWLTRFRDIPPAQVLLAAEELKVSPTEALRCYQDLGFPEPPSFPPDATVDDLALFDDGYGGNPPEYIPPGPFPYQLILETVDQSRPLRSVISRLQEYGYDIPLHVPKTPDQLDAALLNPSGPCSWWGVSTGDMMPFAHLVAASRDLLRPPRELVEKMEQYGIPVSSKDFPEGLSATVGFELLKRGTYDEGYLSAESRLSLQDLLKRARQMNVPFGQIVDWLTQLGIPVLDVTETLRRALSQVPRPT
nr:ATP-binding protein [Streptomyces olivochromogenes]